MFFIESLYWISLCLYHECRGEPLEGQVAVAHVIMTRAAKRRLSVEEVITQKSQFSWVSDNRPDDVTDHGAFVTCMRAAMIAIDQRLLGNTMQGADHYHADYVHPAWAEKLKKIKKIGRHIFYRA